MVEVGTSPVARPAGKPVGVSGETPQPKRTGHDPAPLVAPQQADAAEAARTAVRALVTLWDPSARVSAPMWRRTERLCRRIAARLEELLPAAEWAGTRDRLCRAPLDRAAQHEAHGLVMALLAAERGSGPSLGLRAALEEFRARSRIVLATGERYGHESGEPSPDVAGWASARRPPLFGVDGTWELTVVLDFRDPTSTERYRNVLATALALHDQTLQRGCYRIVVVEQDAAPRHEKMLRGLADLYLHAPHDGPYNRSWAHNVGAVATAGRERYLCFLDADILPDSDFLARSLDLLHDSEAQAMLPHRALRYLDSASTATALRQRLSRAGGQVDTELLHGYDLVTNRGGCVFVSSPLFHALHGFDERYEGWGDEDNEFYEHLAAHAEIDHQSQVLLHLDHPRPVMEQAGHRPNEWLLGAVGTRPTTFGDLDRYAGTERNA